MTNNKTPDEINKYLSENLPHWTNEGSHISRTYQTGAWFRTLALANSIGFLAEASYHHPELVLNYPNLKVNLTTHDAGGVTDKDFELARKIEETVLWQPPAGSALEGFPDKWVS